NLDLEKMYNLHKKNNALATIALTFVQDPSSFGVASLCVDRIVEFVEKPKKEYAPSHWVSSGYYMLEPEVCDMVAGKNFAMMEKDVFPVLAKNHQLYGYQDSGQWFDTGTFESLDMVRKYWKGVKK
ncbi:MAG: sugar phosphate nucleotidyltransferase, partial [Candidatus Nanoarchaeia archaeon]